MTYTIIGRCARTGRLGIGIATFSITVGRYAHSARSMPDQTDAGARRSDRGRNDAASRNDSTSARAASSRST